MEMNLYPASGMDPRTGYGRVELGLAQGLAAAGVTIHASKTAPVTLSVGSPLWAENPYWHDTSLWLYTMSEATVVSPDWVRAINAYYTRVLVPCPQLVDIYRDSGVQPPVECVYAGVDLFPPPYRLHRWDEGNFIFLGYSLGDMRKNSQATMMAFKALYGNDERFRLIIRAREGWRNSWLAGANDPQIQVVSGHLSVDDQNMLYDLAHCFVFPSRGEGFGLPPREAVLAGLPCIATEWLGMWDVAQWGMPLPVESMWPSQFDSWDANAEGSLWANPDKEVLMQHMRSVVENYAEAAAQAARGRDYLLANFRWEHVGHNIACLLRDDNPDLRQP